MSFCNQSGPNNNNGFGSAQDVQETPKKTGGCGCGCSGDQVKYEPLTAEWFKEYAGLIALAVTILLVITNRA